MHWWDSPSTITEATSKNLVFKIKIVVGEFKVLYNKCDRDKLLRKVKND